MGTLWTLNRSCLRKARFPDKTKAVARGKEIQRGGGPRLKAYHCQFCMGWHLAKAHR